jgi:5'-deoxynucleotidase YfbR-like HD superfamily hydrolase
MVVFHDTGTASTGDLATQEKATIEQRRQLVEHLENAGLTGEVELPPASPLPSLLVEGSDRALDECLNAPSVKEVIEISGDITVKAL